MKSETLLKEFAAACRSMYMDRLYSYEEDWKGSEMGRIVLTELVPNLIKIENVDLFSQMGGSFDYDIGVWVNRIILEFGDNAPDHLVERAFTSLVNSIKYIPDVDKRRAFSTWCQLHGARFQKKYPSFFSTI
jgi:hypothetical protein